MAHLTSSHDFEFSFIGGDRTDGQMEQVLRDIMAVLVKAGVRATVSTKEDGALPVELGTFDLLDFDAVTGELVGRDASHDYADETQAEWIATSKKLATAEKSGDWSAFDKRIPLARINSVNTW